jgi:diphthamide synthase (EF-2-diphthine--ammonia ligase)
VKELEARGIDPYGESGEFHATVIDGPIFKHPIQFVNVRFLKVENMFVFLWNLIRIAYK